MKEKIVLNREQLLKAVNLVKPALSTQMYIQALTHVAFEKGLVAAYNDVTAIAVKCPFEFETCLPGDLLIKLLNNLQSDEITVSEVDNNLLFAGGRSKLKIPTLEIDSFPFTMPDEDDLENEFTISRNMIEGFEKCLISVGTDASHPALMGITLESGGTIYSTNNHSLSRFYSDDEHIKLPADIPVILPTFFCQQLISMSKHFIEAKINLSFFKGSVLAHFVNPDKELVASVFSKMLVDIEPMDFDRIIKKYCGDETIKRFATVIPDSFDSSIDRALLILNNEQFKTTKISIDDGKLSMHSKSAMGVAEDSMRFKGKCEQDLDYFLIDPSMVSKATRICNKLAALENVLVLTNEDESFVHVIAHVTAQ